MDWVRQNGLRHLAYWERLIKVAFPPLHPVQFLSMTLKKISMLCTERCTPVLHFIIFPLSSNQNNPLKRQLNLLKMTQHIWKDHSPPFVWCENCTELWAGTAPGLANVFYPLVTLFSQERDMASTPWLFLPLKAKFSISFFMLTITPNLSLLWLLNPLLHAKTISPFFSVLILQSVVPESLCFQMFFATPHFALPSNVDFSFRFPFCSLDSLYTSLPLIKPSPTLLIFSRWPKSHRSCLHLSLQRQPALFPAWLLQISLGNLHVEYFPSFTH